MTSPVHSSPVYGPEPNPTLMIDKNVLLSGKWPHSLHDREKIWVIKLLSSLWEKYLEENIRLFMIILIFPDLSTLTAVGSQEVLI